MKKSTYNLLTKIPIYGVLLKQSSGYAVHSFKIWRKKGLDQLKFMNF